MQNILLGVILGHLCLFQGCTRESSKGDASVTHEIDPDEDTVIATDYAKVVVKRKTFDDTVSLQVRDLKDFKKLFPDLGDAKALGFGLMIEAEGNDVAQSNGLSVTLSVPGSVDDVKRSEVYILGIVEVKGVELRFSLSPDQLLITDADPNDGVFNVVFTTPEVSAGVYITVSSASGPPAGYPNSQRINFDPHAQVAEVKLVGPDPFLPGECSGAFWVSLLDASQGPLVSNHKMSFKVKGIQDGAIFLDDQCQSSADGNTFDFAQGQKQQAFYYIGTDDLRNLQLTVETVVNEKTLEDTWNSFLAGRSSATWVAGHFVYDQSVWDGNVKGPSPLDAQAIPPQKASYRYKKNQASVENISSYVHGINGLAIDISQLNFPVVASDFEFRVGARRGDQTTAIDPTTWPLGPAPQSVSVQWGKGKNHADRIYIYWPNGAIRNQWLYVKVIANAQTGLSQDEVAYFGHLAGDANGDGYVNAQDLGILSSTGDSAVDIGLQADFDRDGYVDTNDQEIYQDSVGLDELLILDSTEPFLRWVRIGSSGWVESFINTIDPEFEAGVSIDLGYHYYPVVWPHLDRLAVHFSERMIMPQAGLSLLGSIVASYDARFANAQISESMDTFTVELTSPIEEDKLKILFEGWTDELGNPLKQNFASSGYQLRFDILPCDADRDGLVFTGDIAAWQVCDGSFFGDETYDYRADWNGDGVCSAIDLQLWQAFMGKNLSNIAEP